MMEDVLNTDVLIVGAGLSGLSAGKLLHEAGIDVLVLEAQDRVGGRLYTVKNDEVGYVDLGGAYVGPTQNRILRMCRDLGIQTHLLDESGDAVFYTKGRRRPFKGTCLPMSNFLAYLDLNNMYRELDRLANQIPADAPWKAKKAEDWDKTTMQQYFDKTIWTKEAMFCAKDIVQLNTTSEPYEVSMLWFLWYLRSAGGVLRINGVENGAQERKLVGGSQQVCEKIAENCLKDRVVLQNPVYKIKYGDNDVLVQLSNGRQYRTQYVILAIPPPMTSRIVFDPPLPPIRNQLIQRVPMGKVIKTHMFYKTPFWRDKGYNGFTSMDDKDGLVGSTMEDVKSDGSHPAIMGFVLGDKAVQYSSLSKIERKQKIAEQYCKVFGSDEALKPIHYEERNWLEDQWSGGCYTVMMPPGFLTTYGKEMRIPVSRLHFASTETATQWSGYMDGAVEAGERAAREILVKIGKLDENEIHLPENEDPEIKALPLDYTFLERWLPSVPQFFIMCGGAVCLMAIVTFMATSKNRKLFGTGIKELFRPLLASGAIGGFLKRTPN